MNAKTRFGLVAIILIISTTNTFGSYYNDVVLSNSPIFYLPFNETVGATAADATGNAHDGTYTGGVTLGAAAGFAGLGTAASFDGTDDRVRVPDSAAFDLGTGNYAVEFWFRTGSTSRGDILTYKGSGGDYGIHNSSQTAQHLSTHHDGFKSQSGNFILNQWNHAVLVRSGGNEQYYINGVASGASAANGNSLNIANDILIGSNFSPDINTPAIPYSGQLDEVAFYGSALSLTNIRADYQAAAGRSIGVNFTGGNGPGDGQTRTLINDNGYAGLVPQLNWNNLGGTDGTAVALVDNSGASVGATISYDGDATYSTGNGSGSANHILMNGYVDDNDNSTSTYTVSNLPYSLYNVILYTDSDAGDSRDESFSLNGGAAIFVSDESNFSGTFTRATATTLNGAGSAGNYVMWENVTGSSFTIIGQSLNFRNFVNGLQIVPVPEPGTLGMAALAVLVISGAARRRILPRNGRR